MFALFLQNSTFHLSLVQHTGPAICTSAGRSKSRKCCQRSDFQNFRTSACVARIPSDLVELWTIQSTIWTQTVRLILFFVLAPLNFRCWQRKKCSGLRSSGREIYSCQAENPGTKSPHVQIHFVFALLAVFLRACGGEEGK
jgi:hypothetical protein